MSLIRSGYIMCIMNIPLLCNMNIISSHPPLLYHRLDLQFSVELVIINNTHFEQSITAFLTVWLLFNIPLYIDIVYDYVLIVHCTINLYTCI